MPTELVAVRAATAASFVRAWDQVAEHGNAILPIDPAAPASHAAALVRQLRPAVLMAPLPGHPDRLHAVRLADAVPVEDGTAMVVATSGSTGPPKGVLLTAAAVEASTRASLRRLGAEQGERWLLCLPWHHVGGLQVIRRSRALGAEPVLHDGFDVRRVAAAVAGDEAQWVSLVPTQLRRLLDARAPLERLRGVLLGGAAADERLLTEAEAAGVRVTTTYGMTETGGGCVHDGVALDDCSFEVLDDGRIRLSGPTLASGYHLDPQATAAAFDQGVFTTNDLGRVDDLGRLRVLGRRDDVIVTGGENVPAELVLARLLTHPQVGDAAVLGLDDPVWGQVVAVAVVAPGEAPTLEELRAHVSEELPRAWAPRRLVLAQQIPRTSLGKPNGPAVRALFP